MRGDGVEHLAGRVARSNTLRVGRKNGKRTVPIIGKLSPLHAFDLVRKVGVLFSVGREQSAPILLEMSSAPANAVPKMLAHAIGHQEFCILGPAVAALGKTYLFLAERLAVGRA